MAVATLKAIMAASLPIHWKDETSVSLPALAAMLTKSNGTNTRNPHAAARPMPRATLRNSVILLHFHLFFGKKQFPSGYTPPPLYNTRHKAEKLHAAFHPATPGRRLSRR